MFVKLIRIRLFITLSIGFMGLLANAQTLHIGVGGGLSLYTGEIETYRFTDGLYLKARPGLDVQLRLHGDNAVGLQAGVWLGSLAGDDRESSSEDRALRAFRFTSPLLAVRLLGELYPMRFFRDEIPLVELYMAIGAEYFRFNPKTDFQNQEFELQPLGTEGQFLAANDGNDPYSLSEWAVPVGGGLRIWIMEDTYINLQALYHYTRTDYLDDVSTEYPDRNALIESGATLAADLSYRRDEIDGRAFPETGTQRGSSGVPDAFITGSVSVVFVLGARSSGIGCPTF